MDTVSSSKTGNVYSTRQKGIIKMSIKQYFPACLQQADSEL